MIKFLIIDELNKNFYFIFDEAITERPGKIL